MTREEREKTYQQRMQITEVLQTLRPELAISLIESIGADLRQRNSIKISRGGIQNVIDADRPDLVLLKEELPKNKPNG